MLEVIVKLNGVEVDQIKLGAKHARNMSTLGVNGGVIFDGA